MAKGDKQQLLFVDTNILLDFYRSRTDAGLSLLAHLDKIHDRLITTCQVEMEFKKNRLNVINESFCELKIPEGGTISPPVFLRGAKAVEMIKRNRKDTVDRVKQLRKRIKRVIEKTFLTDQVYQTVQRVFDDATPRNLRRDSSKLGIVKRRAWKRFIEGCPPRKKDDTSIGDAINWEWILCCVEDANKDVIVVSRDGDYGVTLDDHFYANEWLVADIKRLNKQRNLVVFDRLADALKLIDVKISAEEEKEEDKLAEKATLASVRVPVSGVSAQAGLGGGFSGYSGPTGPIGPADWIAVNPQAGLRNFGLEEYLKRLDQDSS
jgi:hypothetical protein